MARSRTSDEAFEAFVHDHADEQARIDCFRAALNLLRSRTADPRIVEADVAHAMGDTSRSKARRLPELAAMGYFVMAGTQRAVTTNVEGNAWTTPELYETLPEEHKVPHVKIAADKVSLSRAHQRLLQELRNIVTEARAALVEPPDVVVAALEGIIENIELQIQRAETRALD